jgi:hypothetical protein
MKQPIRMTIFGLLLISGIILTGSDSPVFPWPNIAGLLSTAAAVWIAQQLALEADEADHPLKAGKSGGVRR